MLSIKGSVASVEAGLKRLGYESKNLQYHMLDDIGRGGKKFIRKGYRKYLRKRTGQLYRAIGYRRDKKVLYIQVGAKQQYKAQAFTEGKTIFPHVYKKRGQGKYLLIRDEKRGRWARVKSVTMPKRDFFYREADVFVNQEMPKILDAAVDRELERIWKTS